jgi:hypothetical protein
MNVQETINQIGGWGLTGALAYMGAKTRIRFDRANEALYIEVNGKPGWHYYLCIKLEGDDTYTVTMTGVRGTTSKELGKATTIYCDELQSTVEAMYDAVMNEFNDRFIPLGS